MLFSASVFYSWADNLDNTNTVIEVRGWEYCMGYEVGEEIEILTSTVTRLRLGSFEARRELDSKGYFLLG